MRVTLQSDFVLLSEQMWLQALQGSGPGRPTPLGYGKP